MLNVEKKRLLKKLYDDSRTPLVEKGPLHLTPITLKKINVELDEAEMLDFLLYRELKRNNMLTVRDDN